MSEQLKTRVVIPVRASYCYVAEPRPDDDKTDAEGNPVYYYSTQAIIDKATGKAAYKKIQQAVQAAIMKKFGREKVKPLFNNANFKKPVRDADAEGKEGDVYENAWFFNCKTTARYNNAYDQDPNDPQAPRYFKRPGIALKNRRELTTVAEINKHVYSGCYVYLSVTAYYFESDKQRGIALALNNILKDKDGARLDDNIDALDEFADLFDEDALDEFDELDDGLDSGLDDELDDELDPFEDEPPRKQRREPPRYSAALERARKKRRQAKPQYTASTHDDFDDDIPF